MGCRGSSPRVRGTQAMRQYTSNGSGIIPACAGNTPDLAYRGDARRDHPRVCGEHAALNVEALAAAGSSPRVRGTPYRIECIVSGAGIIPACAGNTARLHRDSHAPWDHPRVCGEHQPRVRPTNYGRGSSPRVRGTQTVTCPCSGVSGIIPACAGNTTLCWFVLGLMRDHPRVCGEHLTTPRQCGKSTGSSPRVRGTHGRGRDLHRRPGIIPACAGNTQPQHEHLSG